MKKDLPVPGPGYAEFFKISQEPLKWETLKTALNLNIFEHLKQSDTATNIAAKLSTHMENTEHFMKALVSLGWLSYENGHYQNTKIADFYLVEGLDTSIGQSLLFMDRWFQPLVNGGLLERVKHGPAEAIDTQNEVLWGKAARISVNLSRCGRAQFIASYVSDLPEFSGFTKILDMGAGPGIMGIATTARHPSAHCILFDQAEVCKVADEVIAEYGLESRVATLPGNYLNDPLGEGYDFIMANYTLHFFADQLDRVLEKVYGALNPGGVFMVTTGGSDKDKIDPRTSLLSWLSMSLEGHDYNLDCEDVAHAMLRAGFVSTQHQKVDGEEVCGGYGPLNITIARKTKE